MRVISTASPADREALGRGLAELERLGYRPRLGAAMRPDGYFAGSLARRKTELEAALADPDASAVICARGGYGTATLLDQLRLPRGLRPKLVVGYSDVTILQAYLWKKLRWTSLHGPMVAAGWDHGAANASRIRSQFVSRRLGRQAQIVDHRARRRAALARRSIRITAGRLHHAAANHAGHAVGV